MITLRQLQVLVEAARCGSFRKCGEKLGLSQVSVSEHVRSLEDRLNVMLFVRRSGGSPVLTEQGRAAVVRAEQALGIVADLEREMNPTAGRRRLRFAIQSFLLRELGPVLERIEHDRWSFAVEIDSGTYSQDDIVKLISERSIDVAFYFSLPGQAVPTARHLCDEPLAVFVSRDHPLASLPIVTAADLQRYRSIRLTDSNPLGDLVRRALADIGVGRQDVALSSDEFGLIISSARRGLGYACLFEASAETCNQMGLVKLTLDRAMPSLRVNVAMRPVLELDPGVADFVKLLQDTWKADPG